MLNQEYFCDFSRVKFQLKLRVTKTIESLQWTLSKHKPFWRRQFSVDIETFDWLSYVDCKNEIVLRLWDWVQLKRTWYLKVTERLHQNSPFHGNRVIFSALPKRSDDVRRKQSAHCGGVRKLSHVWLVKLHSRITGICDSNVLTFALFSLFEDGEMGLST